MLLNAPLRFSKSAIGVIRALSNLSLGIFFVHAMVLEVLLNLLQLNFEGYYSILTIPLVAIACFAISALIVWLIRLIPFVRRIT
jgi:surface polysaccharide O-acyltransferase-like enzyme